MQWKLARVATHSKASGRSAEAGIGEGPHQDRALFGGMGDLLALLRATAGRAGYAGGGSP